MCGQHYTYPRFPCWSLRESIFTGQGNPTTHWYLESTNYSRLHWSWSFLWYPTIISGGRVLVFFIISSTPVTDRLMTAESGFADGSLASRISVWHGVVDLAKANPLLGTGPGVETACSPSWCYSIATPVTMRWLKNATPPHAWRPDRAGFDWTMPVCWCCGSSRDHTEPYRLFM